MDRGTEEKRVRAGERQLHRERVDFDEEANARVSGRRELDASVSSGRKDAMSFLSRFGRGQEAEAILHFISAFLCPLFSLLHDRIDLLSTIVYHRSQFRSISNELDWSS